MLDEFSRDYRNYRNPIIQPHKEGQVLQFYQIDLSEYQKGVLKLYFSSVMRIRPYWLVLQ